jgi:hypothetical protein
MDAVDSTVMSYAVKLGGAAIAILLLGVLGMLLFGALWARIGIGAAIVIVCGGMVFLAWRSDKKAREARAGLDRI